MKSLKIALAAACVLASTAASAGIVPALGTTRTSRVSTCYYQYSIFTADAQYDVYNCYSNGDGSY